MTVPDRGEIVHVDFPPADESPPGEFGDPHRAIVIQYTRASDESAVVIPISSRERRSRAREVILTPDIEGIEERSVAIVNLITTVSVEGRIVPDAEETDGSDIDAEGWRLGRLPPGKLKEIEKKLSNVLGTSRETHLS